MVSLLALALSITLPVEQPSPSSHPATKDSPSWVRSAANEVVNPIMLNGLKWRNLGPFRGGRVSAVAGVMGEVGTYYMGLPQGGLWKSTGAGQTWFPVFDSVKETSTIGSIAVSASDPNTVYVGTGEIAGQGEGYGAYKSTDAGKTWTHLGLADSHIIPVILVDPKDPNTVLLAAQGNARTKDTRGVYRSTDGGATWTRWSAAETDAGVVSMATVYDHPEIVVAGTRQAGKPAANKLYKSSDFGKTWTPLEGKGLPPLRSRYTIALAQNTNAQRMYLIGTFGLFRSDDGGANWRRMAESDQRIANGQGDYNCGVAVDTKDPNIVYTISTCLYRSLDGGETFEGFKGAPGGDDPHFLWIDPKNANRILYGGDQGATVSLDHGQTWGSWYNQPSAQVYHIATDNRYPYWVYATQQDSGVVGTSSRRNYGQIGPLDWTPHPGFEFGYVAIDPLNPNISYSYSETLHLCRVKFPSGQWVECGPTAVAGETFRQGLAPICFNPNNPRELLTSNQYLMSSTDGGQHWKKLSPDLGIKTIPSTDPKGKPTTSQSSISDFSFSTANPNVIWAGTGNGLVHVSKDKGANWNLANTGLPSSSVLCIDASHTQPGAAYVCMRSANNSPTLYRTRDYGQTWTPISRGFPTEGALSGPVNVIRCDTKQDGLLFAGTSKEMFVSFDDGDHWQSLRLNMPTTIMNDLQVKGDDLVLGTYGRGIWVLDDISPLRQLVSEPNSGSGRLFKLANGIRVRSNVNDDTPMPPEIPHADNPPCGVSIYYSLGSKPSTPVTIEILDRKGNLVRHLTSAEPVPYADPKPEIAPMWIGKRKPLSAEVGLNRAEWDIRYDDPEAFIHDAQDVMQATIGGTKEAVPGPLALPGNYTVRLTVDGKTYSQPLVVKNDPRSPASQSDLEKFHEVEMDMLACIKASWDSHEAVVAARSELKDAKNSSMKEVADAAKAFDTKLEALEGKIVYTRRFFLGANASNFVDLNTYLLVALGSMSRGDSAPSEATYGSYATCYYLTDTLLTRLRGLNGKPLTELNALLTKNGAKAVKAVSVPENPRQPLAKYRVKTGVPLGNSGQIKPPKDDDDDDGDGDGANLESTPRA